MTSPTKPKSNAVSRELPPAEETVRNPWFLRDEHKHVRTCKCFCGHTFQSQAREIEYLDKVEAIDKHGLPERTKEGQPVFLKRIVKGVLSYEACPKCKENRIASFT